VRGQAFLFCAIAVRMESLIEYLFAADIRLADEAARRHGWRVYGRPRESPLWDIADVERARGLLTMPEAREDRPPSSRRRSRDAPRR
jgi:hypothetical protein